MTMASSAPGGYDHLSVSVLADNAAYTTIWTQPSASVSSWEQASVTVPSNARTISFDFVSGPYSEGEWKEGAYIDNILVTQKSDASWSHVNSLPLYSRGTFDIEVSIDPIHGIPDSIKLYYRSSTSSPFALYTDSRHTDGLNANGETIHFDSSLTGGALDYQFYSIASGGGVTEPQPSAADASTSVDVTSPQTTSSVSRSIMASGWYDGPVKVSLIGSDARSGVGSIQYKLDGSTWATWGGDLNIDKEGAHNLTYHAVDKAGNVEEDHKISINIDGTAPMTSYSFDGAGRLSLLASDGASGPTSTRYRLDGGEWQTYSSPFDVLNAGYDSLEYYSTDNAGNAEVVRTMNLNNAPMSKVTLALSGVGSSYSEGDTVKLVWSCDDPAGEVDHYEVLVDGAVVKTLGGTASSFDLTGLAEGEHSITVRAVDSGGNSTYQMTALSIGSAQQDDSPTSLTIIVTVVMAAVAVAAGLLFWRRRSK
jgi:hypothetical protein